MKYKKNKLTHKQFAINRQQQYESNITDRLLYQCGLNPNTFAKLDLKIVQAKIAAFELERFYFQYLSEIQIEQIRAFNRKVSNSKKFDWLRPNQAYPILNLATKIKRQAHKKELINRQKIQALRGYNQP